MARVATVARVWKDASTVILAARFPRNAPSVVKDGRNPVKTRTDAIGSVDSDTVSIVSSPAQTSTPHVTPIFDYKVLMLERNSRSPFMPSAYVFPGGKISKADFTDRWSEVFRDVLELKGLGEYSLLRRLIKQPTQVGDHSEDQPERLPMFKYWDAWGRDTSSEIAFRISAIRETFEESGVLLCTNKQQINLTIDLSTEEVHLDRAQLMNSCLPVAEIFGQEELAKWRKEVNNDANKFVDMCSHLNIIPNVWCLHDWNCWLTPTNMPKMHNNRRYDTMFYLVCLPSAPAITKDDKEITLAEWATPLDLLCRHYGEELWLAPPQIYELCRLCSKSELDELYAFAQSREQFGVQRWLPVRIICADGTIAVLPGDELYPKTPDWNGEESSPSVSQSIDQLRITTLAHHRFEFLGRHNTNVVCTEGQTHGHLSPNPGHRAWHTAREENTLPSIKVEKQ